MILFLGADWLFVGGFVGFCCSWHRTTRSLLLLPLAITSILVGLWWSIRYYELNPGSIEGYNDARVDPYSTLQRFFYLMSGGVIVLSFSLYLLRKHRVVTPRSG